MPPLGRRRRRSVLPYLAVGLVIAVGGLVLAGGAAKVPAASGSFRQAVNRSYALQASVLVDQSNGTGKRLSTLMGTMARMSRQTLEDQLDTLVLATSDTAAAAAALSPPAPTGSMGANFVSAMDERASAVAAIRRAVDGLLGLPAPPAPGAPDATGRLGATPLSPAQAVDTIGTAGSDLLAADRTYASVRAGFRDAPGHATLPGSVWITDPGSWDQGPVQTLVSDLTASTTLAPVTRVVLLQSSLRTGLGAVPTLPAATGSPGSTGSASGSGTGTAGTAPGSGTILPTRALGITAVVANQGNVVAVDVSVSASVSPAGGGAGRAVSRDVTVAAGTSLTVALPSLPVTPGQAYSLTVSIKPPPAQTDMSGTADTFSIRIAPEAPPPTTPPPTTTTPKARTTPKAKTAPKARTTPKAKTTS